MDSVTIPLIIEQLKKLPQEKLPIVYDFVSFLESQTSRKTIKEIPFDYLQPIQPSSCIKQVP